MNINHLHASPFDSDFANYLGKFSNMLAKYPSVKIDVDKLPKSKRLSFNDFVCNFDFDFLLTISNAIYGSLHKYPEGVWTTAQLPCSYIKNHDDIETIYVTLHFIKLPGQLKYCMDVWLAEPNRQGSFSDPSRCVRLIRENSSITAYVASSEDFYQFSYSGILTPDSVVGTCFHLTKTIKIINTEEPRLQIVSDTNCRRAVLALMQNVNKRFKVPLNDTYDADTLLGQPTAKVLGDWLSIKLRLIASKKPGILDKLGTPPDLTSLLTDFYCEFNYVISKRTKTVDEINLPFKNNPPISEHDILVKKLRSIVHFYESI